jgi:hypothetical protein
MQELSTQYSAQLEHQFCAVTYHKWRDTSSSSVYILLAAGMPISRSFNCLLDIIYIHIVLSDVHRLLLLVTVLSFTISCWGYQALLLLPLSYMSKAGGRRAKWGEVMVTLVCIILDVY